MATSSEASDASDIPPVEMDEEARPEPVAPERLAEAEALKEQGNKLLAAFQYNAAVEKYTAAIEICPTAVFLSNRAMAYIKREDFGLAIADADAAIALDPSYLKSLYRRASANFALGRYKKALRDLRAVVKVRPNDPDAKRKLKACDRAVKEAAFAAAIESEQTAPLSQTIDVNSIVVEASYDGPVLESGDNVTMEFVQAMIERFRAQKLIHRKFVIMMLLAAREHFAALPSLLRVSFPESPGPQFTVCGDTHGQFYDLLHIFEIGGMPSAENPFLFNGDFVDRGSFSVEVVTTLIALKLATPRGLFMLRGNHESKSMSNIYGFAGEVRHKYDESVLALFSEVFNVLPLCAVLENKVLVVHGGISTEPDVTLADMEAVPRNREPPESGLFSDLLWSDPQPFPGRSPSKRGVGYMFGSDITERFLQRNGLNLIVRSHEVKDEGYEVMHNGKVITVFSAPNYCDSIGNKGAFLRFRPGDDGPVYEVTQYTAVQHPPIKPMAYAFGGGMSGMF